MAATCSASWSEADFRQPVPLTLRWFVTGASETIPCDCDVDVLTDVDLESYPAIADLLDVQDVIAAL